MTKKNIDQLKNMVDGWKNVFIKDEDVEALAAEREQVCNSCPHKKKFTCALCDCPIHAKVRSVNSDCPDNRWAK